MTPQPRDDDAPPDEAHGDDGEAVVEVEEINPRDIRGELSQYLYAFRAYPVLTDNVQQRRLFAQYHKGSPTQRKLAFEAILYGNVRLCVAVALRYKYFGVPVVDLV